MKISELDYIPYKVRKWIICDIIKFDIKNITKKSYEELEIDYHIVIYNTRYHKSSLAAIVWQDYYRYYKFNKKAFLIDYII